MKFLLCVAFMAVVPCAFSASWTYNGAVNNRTTWSQINGSYCGGMRQSPINLETSVMVDVDFGTFVLDGYSANNPKMDMDNNGHGVTVRLNELQPNNMLYSVSGGGLPTTYTATQFHLHWGSHDEQGSEHQLDGETFSAELHMVHYDTSKYADLVAALTSLQWDACAVLGVILDIGDHNAAFDHFLNLVPNISDYASGNRALGMGNLPSFPIRSVLPFDLSRFYRYNGSLTVPACYESVIWTVFEEHMTISHDQLIKLRAVIGDDGNPVVDNHRLVEPLHARTLYYSRPASVGNNPGTTPQPGAACAISPMRAVFLVAFALGVLVNLI